MTEAELTCKEMTELVTDYLEQRLSQTEHSRFEQHLAACPGCVTYLEQIRITVKSLGAKPPIELPTELESDLLSAFRRWKTDAK